MRELGIESLSKASGGLTFIYSNYSFDDENNPCWPPDPTNDVCMFFTTLTVLDLLASGSGGDQYIANVDIMGNPTGF